MGTAVAPPTEPRVYYGESICTSQRRCYSRGRWRLEGEALGVGSRGAGHPPLLHPPPPTSTHPGSETAEIRELRLVQIAEAPYWVLSGGRHSDSRGADGREGRSTGAMQPLRPLRSLLRLPASYKP